MQSKEIHRRAIEYIGEELKWNTDEKKTYQCFILEQRQEGYRLWEVSCQYGYNSQMRDMKAAS